MHYGFDIGGSKIAPGVFDAARNLEWETRVATPHASDEVFLSAVCERVVRRETGDPKAHAHVARYLDLLAVCLGSILTIVDPHIVVPGGGPIFPG